MVVLVTLLWACAMQTWLPPLKAKDAAREEFVRRWLELRMEREVAERLERAQSALLESERHTDAERKAFIKRWLELRMERERERERAAQKAQ